MISRDSEETRPARGSSDCVSACRNYVVYGVAPATRAILYPSARAALRKAIRKGVSVTVRFPRSDHGAVRNRFASRIDGSLFHR